MVQILAPFLLLSALSGTCLSLSYPVKRDVVKVEADLNILVQYSDKIGTDFTNPNATLAVGSMLLSVAALIYSCRLSNKAQLF